MQNKTLSKLIKLSSKVTIYIPSTKNVNEEINNEKYVNECASLLSDCFGGSTSSKALGYWNSKTLGLVKEFTTVVYAYSSDKDLENNIEKVVDYCEKLKNELSQESIALEVNGEMYFI